MSKVFTEEQVINDIACEIKYYKELWLKGMRSHSHDLKLMSSHAVCCLLMLKQHMGFMTREEVSEALDDFGRYKAAAIYDFVTEVANG